MNKKKVIGLTLGALLLLGIGLNFFIKPQSTTFIEQPHSTAHSVPIKNDQEFLINMIPHHEEAVTTSQYALSQATDPLQKSFLEKVISTQSSEIAQMKKWHLEWFGSEYTENVQYQPMMGDLASLSGAELEKAYIQGMIGHHQGAIHMAKQIQPLTTRTEIKEMANAIITTQEQEVTLLKKWLVDKY